MTENVIAIIDEKEKEIMKKLYLEINTLYQLKMSLGQSALTASEVDKINDRLNKDLPRCESQIQDWWNSTLIKYKVDPSIDVSKLTLMFDSNKIVL